MAGWHTWIEQKRQGLRRIRSKDLVLIDTIHGQFNHCNI